MAKNGILYDEMMFIGEEDVFEEENALDEPVYEERKPCRTRSYHRKQEVRHKKRLRCNAINAMNNLDKRKQEDAKNVSFCYNHQKR